MKSLLLTSLAVTLLASSSAQAANVCSVFDGNTIGATHTVLPNDAAIGVIDNSATNQDLFTKNDVYFGGNTLVSAPPIPNATSPQIIASNQTYDLTQLGSITLAGDFYNRDFSGLHNESFLAIIPTVSVNPNPTQHIPVTGREGIIAGIGGVNFRMIDYVNGTTTVRPHDAVPAPAITTATWQNVSVTYAIQGTNFVVTEFSLDGSNKLATVPTVIGPVANYPWLSNMKVAMGVDDAASQICIDDHQAAVATTAVPTLSNISLAVLGLLLFGFAYSRKSQFTA